jgi:SPP1 gp7 family putative phage head morphogenesis protein
VVPSKNSDYWKIRFGQLEAAQNQKGAEAYLEIEKIYKQAQKEIEGKINTWYQRFATNNGVSMAEARKMLSGADLKEFKWDVKDYIKHGQDNAMTGTWMKQLENASAKFHISRLEVLKIHTQHSLEMMFEKQLGITNGTMTDILESGYYHIAYELQKGFGIGWDIAGLDQGHIKKLLSKPWAVDGKNFSERIWDNKQKLISEIHNELTRNVMLGQDPQKAIDAIAKKMNASKYNAGRLVMTEEAYFSSAAQKDCFNDLDVEEYEIVATLDSHTSDICQSLDGQVFPMKDFEPGITAPPFHVYCRSTTVPHFDENFGQIGQRAARDAETGKAYYIPDNMTYKEWKEKYVDNENKESQKTDYLVRSHTPGQDITKEQTVVNEVISSMPEKIKQSLESGTIIDIGKDGASQYDYIHDILYVAKGADKTEVIHEIGHMVENKLLDAQRVLELKQQILKDVIPGNFVKEIYYDASNNPVEIFLIKSDKFVSEYQGRVYISDWSELLDDNMLVRPELLAEFMSEPFREYIECPDRLKQMFPQFYQIISEVL